MTASERPAAEGPRPLLLTVAAGLLGVTALCSLLVGLFLYPARTLVGCLIGANDLPKDKQIKDTGALKDALNACTSGHPTKFSAAASDKIGSALTSNLVQGILFLVVFAGIAFFMLRGRPITRWIVVGFWVLANLVGISGFGLLPAISTAGSGIFPLYYTAAQVIGAVTFTAAAVLVNLPQVTRYLNARRPIRTAAARGGAAGRPVGTGGLFGGLFGGAGRPGAGGATGGPTSSSSTPSGSSSSRVSMDKPDAAATAPRPATTRPARAKGASSGGSGNTGRAKGKRRG